MYFKSEKREEINYSSRFEALRALFESNKSSEGEIVAYFINSDDFKTLNQSVNTPLYLKGRIEIQLFGYKLLPTSSLPKGSKPFPVFKDNLLPCLTRRSF